MNNDDTVESFMSFPDVTEDSKLKQTSDMSNLNKQECLNNYSPKHMEVNNVCDPVATYQGEMNAQGLNYPIGFDKNNDQYPV